LAIFEGTGIANSKAGGGSAFSDLSCVAGNDIRTGTDASTQLSWTDGSTIATATGYRKFTYAFPFDTVGVGVSFKYTLEAESVRMSVFLVDFDGGQSLTANNSNLFSATVSSGGTFSQTVFLGDGFDGDHGKGWFDLEVYGSIGDEVTISHTLASDIPARITNVGIQAVTITAIPELGVPTMGLFSLAFLLRRRR
jgi:hypothetical protein